MSSPETPGNTSNTRGHALSNARVAERLARRMNASPLRFAVLVVLVLQVLAFVAFRPSYGTNDDVFMTMVASGRGISPAPDAHLVFTNIVIGEALKHLYSFLPEVPWYGAYLLLVHLASQAALLYGVIAIGRNVESKEGRRPLLGTLARADAGELGLRLSLFVLHYALVGIPLLNRLQFTSTAFLAAAAGVFLLLTALRRKTGQADAPVFALLAAATALIVAGGLIRIESLGLALLIAGPVGLAAVVTSSKRALAPCGIAAGVAAAAVVGAVAFDRFCYEHDPQWAGFRPLNQLRGKFHDEGWTKYSPETAPLFARVGWSENDHAMIAQWFSDDAVIYAPEKLTTVVQGHPWQRERQTADRYTSTFREIVRNRAVLSVFLALPLVLMVLRGGASAKRSVLGTVVAAVALVIIITWAKKAPPIRVFFPVMSFPLTVALLSLGWRRDDDCAGYNWSLVTSLWSFRQWRRQPIVARVAAMLLVVAMPMGVYSQIRRTAHVTADRARLATFLDEVDPTGQTLYVSWEAALPYELVSPLDNLQSWPPASFLSLAWTQGTPCHEAVKRQFAIADVVQALFSRQDVQLIAGTEHRELFEKFVREHFQVDVEFVSRLEVGHKFTVGQYRLRPRASRTAAAGDNPKL